jgi:hypothetical protein
MRPPNRSRGVPPVENGRRKPVAKIAPRMICPSMPMFHRPGAKVKSNAEEQRTRGTQTPMVWASFTADPSPPWKRIKYVCRGGAPEIRRISVVKRREMRRVVANLPKKTANLAAQNISYTADFL